MRKLEAIAGEVVNEMDYLKKREGKMRDTNGAFYTRRSKGMSRSNLPLVCSYVLHLPFLPLRVNKSKGGKHSLANSAGSDRSGCVAGRPPSRLLPKALFDRFIATQLYSTKSFMKSLKHCQ